MTDKYAAMLTLRRDSIEVLEQTMPITIIREWEVSIRPCEFDNFARLLGIAMSVRTNSAEYHYLMRWLTLGSGSLVDLVESMGSNLPLAFVQESGFHLPVFWGQFLKLNVYGHSLGSLILN